MYFFAVFSQDKICSMADLVPEGFGENYITGKKGIDDFTKKFKVKIDYQGITKFVCFSYFDNPKKLRRFIWWTYFKLAFI